jgi:hypothetical protein
MLMTGIVIGVGIETLVATFLIGLWEIKMNKTIKELSARIRVLEDGE